jgi:hypothetical protein
MDNENMKYFLRTVRIISQSAVRYAQSHCHTMFWTPEFLLVHNNCTLHTQGMKKGIRLGMKKFPSFVTKMYTILQSFLFHLQHIFKP